MDHANIRFVEGINPIDFHIEGTKQNFATVDGRDEFSTQGRRVCQVYIPHVVRVQDNVRDPLNLTGLKDTSDDTRMDWVGSAHFSRQAAGGGVHHPMLGRFIRQSNANVRVIGQADDGFNCRLDHTLCIELAAEGTQHLEQNFLLQGYRVASIDFFALQSGCLFHSSLTNATHG